MTLHVVVSLNIVKLECSSVLLIGFLNSYINISSMINESIKKLIHYGFYIKIKTRSGFESKKPLYIDNKILVSAFVSKII